MMRLSLAGADKAAVLAALYNASKPQGMGFLHYDPKPMTTEEAATLMRRNAGDFDYVQGRVMKVNLSKDSLETWLYDLDNGHGAAKAALLAAGIDLPEVTEPAKA